MGKVNKQYTKTIFYLVGKILFTLVFILILLMLVTFLLKLFQEYFIFPHCYKSVIAFNYDLKCEGIYEVWRLFLWGNFNLFLTLIILFGSVYFFLWEDIKKIRWIHIGKTLLTVGVIFIFLQLFFTFVDVYNRKQVNQVIKKLSFEKPESYNFTNIKEYNSLYNTHTIPLFGCFYIVDTNRYGLYYPNNRKGYVLGMKYHSFLYKFLYNSDYFVYPQYDLPTMTICDGVCRDKNKEDFLTTINHFCKD